NAQHNNENRTETPKTQNESFTRPTAELPCRNTKHTHAATHTPPQNCPAGTQNTLMQLHTPHCRFQTSAWGDYYGMLLAGRQKAVGQERRENSEKCAVGERA